MKSKSVSEPSILSKLVTNWNIIPVFIAGIILIILLINDLKSNSLLQLTHTISVLHVEYILSFITSYILFYWMLYPIMKDMYNYFNLTGNVIYNIRGMLFYYIYTIVLLLTSPFGLFSIRFFLIEDKTHITFISILTIISTLFTMYFCFGIGNR